MCAYGKGRESDTTLEEEMTWCSVYHLAPSVSTRRAGICTEGFPEWLAEGLAVYLRLADASVVVFWSACVVLEVWVSQECLRWWFWCVWWW